MPLSPQRKAAGRTWLVSNGGGHSPIWSADGRELFYEDLERRIQLVACTTTGNSFVAAIPRSWSRRQVADIGFFPSFDVAPDGKRVLTLLPAEDPKPETILHVLLNLDGELRRRVPPHK
jgi:hypothetical protein